jgi:hypothetical protein
MQPGFVCRPAGTRMANCVFMFWLPVILYRSSVMMDCACISHTKQLLSAVNVRDALSQQQPFDSRVRVKMNSIFQVLHWYKELKGIGIRGIIYEEVIAQRAWIT